MDWDGNGRAFCQSARIQMNRGERTPGRSNAEGRTAMPDWKHEIRARLAKLRLEPTREAAIVEELAQHLDDCYAELLASGLLPDKAYRETLAELSSQELLARQLLWVERQIQLEPIVLGTNRRTNMITDLW